MIAPVREGLDRRDHQGQGSAQAGSRRPARRSRPSTAARRRRTRVSSWATRSSRSTARRSPTAPRWRRPSRGTSPGSEVTLAVKRGEQPQDVKHHRAASPTSTIYVAGEPRLYGWVYNYAEATSSGSSRSPTCIEWILRWMYFHDWRGALRPTLTGVIAAIWGLGFVHLIGFALDPLILVMPFLITARAVEPRHPDARPLLRGVRAPRLEPAQGDRRRRSPSCSCRPSRAS